MSNYTEAQLEAILNAQDERKGLPEDYREVAKILEQEGHPAWGGSAPASSAADPFGAGPPPGEEQPAPEPPKSDPAPRREAKQLPSVPGQIPEGGEELDQTDLVIPYLWRIVAEPPCKFYRRAGMRPLPEPARGGHIDEVVPFVNLEPASWILAKVWLVGALRGAGPYFTAILQGEHGSAKTTTSKVLRDLIDPSSVEPAAPSKDERDLMVTASASHVVVYDNLSGCPHWLSDALCRIATGGGFRARKLYTDDDEQLFTACRPILLNGIDQIATRPDLASRSIILRLPKIKRRRRESRFWRELEPILPRALAGLLDGVSMALRRSELFDDVDHRMADAASWGMAAAPALGMSADQVDEALNRLGRDVAEVSIEADPVAQAVMDLLEEFGGSWSGEPKLLLRELAKHADDDVVHGRGWPKNARWLSDRLTRAAPAMRTVGVELERIKLGGRRLVKLERATEAQEA